ncbi:MAG: hypothetical protein RXQ68_02960 [Candidatus Nanopusillus sp.]
MDLYDIIDKLYKIKEKSINAFYDYKSKKLKLSEFIEEITPESWRKYIKNFLNYSFPKTRENLYRSYLVNTGIFLYLIGLYGLLNDSNYNLDNLLYSSLGYSYSMIFPTLYYKIDKFREIINRIIPYI